MELDMKYINKVVHHCTEGIGCNGCPLRYHPNCFVFEDFFHYIRKLKTERADTLQELQCRVAMHFGTYLATDEVPITEVFKLLSKIEKEMLEETNYGKRKEM